MNDYHIIPYEGAKTGSAGPGTSGKDLTLRVVYDLLLKVDDCDKSLVTFDNWYSSSGLVASMGLLGIACRATARADRIGKAPVVSNAAMKKCKRGEMSKAQSKEFPLTVVKWHDNSVVTVLSNCDSVSDNDTVQRWDRSAKAFVNIDRPASIQHYNKNMGGVDYLDRGVAEYRIRIRSKKWWYPHLTNRNNTKI